MSLAGWVGGHMGHLWPNGDIYNVGLNRGHIGKSFDSKYLENGDKVEVGTPAPPQHICRTNGLLIGTIRFNLG